MKPAPFIHHQPGSLHEALRILADVAPRDGRVLAGGQSLVPMMAFRVARPPELVDINAVPELAHLSIDGDALQIGACVRHNAFAANNKTGRVPGLTGALLAHVMLHIAHYPIRTRGTFCGSLAHADPASEWCAVAAALDATLIAQSAGGRREIAARDFFEAVMTTALRPDEILVAARLPLLPEDTRFGFAEFSRRAGDYAIGLVIATLRVEAGRIAAPRLAIGGAEAFPRRLGDVEAFLDGAQANEGTIQRAAALAGAALDPLEDATTSAAYRRTLVTALAERALRQACA